MTARHKAHGRPAVGLLVLLVLPIDVLGQDDHITAAATPDRPSVALSESVRITLTITGPAPLRVEVPESLLTTDSKAVWEVHPDGPAKVEAQEGRERWSQVFRLKPWLAGEKVPVAFAPFKATAGNALAAQPVTWAPITLKVQSVVTEPKAENARPVTGIEDLPPPTVVPPDRIGWMFVAGLSVLFTVAVLVALRRRRTRPKPLPPHEWAAAQFDRLDRDRAAGRELADRLAAVLREFVERRFGLPATRLTTAELIDECERADWPGESAAALRDLLDRCDRAKFAGDVPDTAEGPMLIAQAREWVAAASPPTPAGGL